MDVGFDYNYEFKVSCQSSVVKHQVTGFALFYLGERIASSQQNTNTLN